jgi:hypothetical protein
MQQDRADAERAGAAGELAGTGGPGVGAAGELAGTGGPGVGAAGELAGTGEPRVDAAVGLLAELDQRPVGEHPEVFQRVHARLTEVLGDLDEDAG